MKADHSQVSKSSSRRLWLKTKTVLLLDADSTTREARSKAMRALGVTVHSAASITEAKDMMGAAVYNLVLVDLGSDTASAETFVQEVRDKNSRQLVAFLVGSPMFVAMSLRGERVAGPRSVPLRTESVNEVEERTEERTSLSDFGRKIRDAEDDQLAC